MRTKTSKYLKNTQIILKNKNKMIVNDGFLDFLWGQWQLDLLPRFEQLSLFTRLHLISLSKVMTV